MKATGHKPLKDLPGKVSSQAAWALPLAGAWEALGLEMGSIPLAPLNPETAADTRDQPKQRFGEHQPTILTASSSQRRVHCHRLQQGTLPLRSS